MSKKGKKAGKKAPSCTLEQLQKLGAQQLSLVSGGNQIPVGICVPRTFSSGSYGLGYSGPVVIALPDGGFAECQASINITVKHSKPEVEDELPAEAA